MKVWVTPVQFAWLQHAMMRAEISRDTADVDHIIGQLCIFALSNGCDNFGNYIDDSLDNGAGVIYIPPSNRR